MYMLRTRLKTNPLLISSKSGLIGLGQFLKI